MSDKSTDCQYNLDSPKKKKKLLSHIFPLRHEFKVLNQVLKKQLTSQTETILHILNSFLKNNL